MRRAIGCAALLGAVMLGGCSARHAEAPAQNVSIRVTDEGFVPATVSVSEDRPVTLTVTRVTKARWAEDLKIPDSGITRELPLNQPVVIEFTPEQPGQVEMAAGLYLGKVVVQEGGGL